MSPPPKTAKQNVPVRPPVSAPPHRRTVPTPAPEAPSVLPPANGLPSAARAGNVLGAALATAPDVVARAKMSVGLQQSVGNARIGALAAPPTQAPVAPLRPSGGPLVFARLETLQRQGPDKREQVPAAPPTQAPAAPPAQAPAAPLHPSGGPPVIPRQETLQRQGPDKREQAPAAADVHRASVEEKRDVSVVQRASPEERAGKSNDQAAVPFAGTGEKPDKAAAQASAATTDRRTGLATSRTATGGGESSEAAPRKKSSASVHEDPGFQAVVRRLDAEAVKEKTPVKVPGRKSAEMVAAAQLTEKEIAEQSGYSNHLSSMMQTVPGLTVEQFMDQFKHTTNELLAKALPQTKQDHDSEDAEARVQAAGAAAKSRTASQAKAQSDRLQDEARKDPLSYKDEQTRATKPEELAMDPVGKKPEIPKTGAAAPKPKSREEISLDDKSQALDEALANHSVHGQKINIDEGSLALPVSGEPTFDEAGEAKRKAQEEIKRFFPQYRTREKAVIVKSEADIQTTVEKGLEFHHGTRADSFGHVLRNQSEHKTTLKGKKREVFSEIGETYEGTRKAVTRELARLPNPETVFNAILQEAQNDFNDKARQELEYIYTPGILDYSDWKDKHEKEIEQECENQKRRDEGASPLVTYAEALKIVRGRSAEKYFGILKSIFISNVNWGVEQKIAKPVVDVLNKAKQQIQEGNRKASKAFSLLDPQEQEETKPLFDAVKTRFDQLEQSVDDKQREIVGDLARTYSRSLGKLQSTFDEIKKDVLTSWWEKAWNKLKAIVNAIIDFATRIVELLGRIAYLVGDIISSPRAFFRNLASGISTGFSTFIGRIDEYLATAFFDWLRGSSGVAVRMPPDLGPQGIFSLFTQLLDLSLETVWQRMEVVYDKTIANAFRRGEVAFEKGLEIFRTIRDQGLGGLWDDIQNSLGSILDDTLESIKENLLYTAIKKVISEIGKMLIPGGGFIAIAEKIIRLLQFIVTARNKILDLIEAFVDSAEMAVKGDVGGIVNHITAALTKFITVALDFLVTFFGLVDIKDRVTGFIERMRTPVIRGIDWVLGKFKPLVMRKARLKEIGIGGKEEDQGADKRTEAQKKADVHKAVVDAQKVMADDDATPDSVQAKLPGIKSTYGLTSLVLVDDGQSEFHVEATINPHDETEEIELAKADPLFTAYADINTMKLRPEYQGNETIRDRFYKKRYRVDNRDAVLNRAVQSVQPARPGLYPCENPGPKGPNHKPFVTSAEATMDHFDMAVNVHWNTEGNDTDQGRRNNWFDNPSVLRVFCESCNKSKNVGEFLPDVKLGFRGPKPRPKKKKP